MSAFRVFLALVFIVITSYTAVVAANHGLNLLPIFFGDIAAMGWPGQFNLDFLGFLLFSAFWVAWRHQFSPGGMGLGLLAFFTGAPFLALYLLLASRQAKGDMRILLLGPSRVP